MPKLELFELGFDELEAEVPGLDAFRTKQQALELVRRSFSRES